MLETAVTTAETWSFAADVEDAGKPVVTWVTKSAIHAGDCLDLTLLLGGGKEAEVEVRRRR